MVVSLAPIGVLVGALIVGPPQSVPNDVRLDNTPTVPTTDEVVESAGPVPSGPTAAEPTTTTTTVTTAVTSTVASIAATTTTTEVDRAAVTVLVVNASAVSGVASSTAQTLNSAGFTDTLTGDTSPVPVTVVHYKAGFDVQAELVATALGLPDDVVLPYPGTAFTDRDGESDVIVLVGADRAG